MLTQRRALITGAAKGIGKALSQVHLEKGHRVILVDKDPQALEQLAQNWGNLYSNQMLCIPCDISQQDQVIVLADRLTSEKGDLHYLYNNAGVMGELAPVWALDTEKLHQVLEVNLFGMLYIIQAFMPRLLAQSVDTSLVNMASLYALCSGSQMAAYAMSKHAVLALSEALYFDLKQVDSSLHVALAFPSFTDTALLTTNSSSPFQEVLQSLLGHSRPAIDVARHVVEAVEKKQHYILPDREVKDYCEQRSQAIVNQEAPHYHNLEKLLSTLLRRQK